MTNLTVTEAKAHFLEIVRKADTTMENFLLSKNGRPVAVLMSYDEYESWIETLNIITDEDVFNDIVEAKKQINKGQFFSFEEVFEKGKKNK
ncbi:MAG: type II toxin-antitoxin system Phd/YefM family antitoxin [Candidatus Omnitrophica bacterium]|nr:type II toxin-antitoxin system Phd/YefM family antitoxin [Candidatus Omnitrophota bacterium]